MLATIAETIAVFSIVSFSVDGLALLVMLFQ